MCACILVCVDCIAVGHVSVGCVTISTASQLLLVFLLRDLLFAQAFKQTLFVGKLVPLFTQYLVVQVHGCVETCMT